MNTRRCNTCGRLVSESGVCSYELCGRYAELFFARVKVVGDCWEWQGKCYPNGYGSVKRLGRELLAHRYAYELEHGRVPAGLVCHHCDNRRCVNPRHLFLGTQADNLADMDRKGRRNPADNRGERNPAARLTAADVREIRRQVAGGVSVEDLAARFGVSEKHLRRVAAGHYWTAA